MPLIPGRSKATKRKNFHEFRHGNTFKRTARKFGKKRALKQMQAVVLSKARESKPKRKTARKRA